MMLKHDGDFYCLNYLHSFKTENKLGSHKKICQNKVFRNNMTPFENTRILELNQYQKSDKASLFMQILNV